MRFNIIFCSILVGLLILSGQACQKDDDRYGVGTPNGIPLDQIISFTSVSPGTLEADSTSFCSIIVKIDRRASVANHRVRFFSDAGKFANGDTVQTVTANSDGFATARLVNDKATKANIRVSVMDTYTIDTIVNFIPAKPDDILLTTDKFDGDTQESFEITTSLFRNPQRGKPSDPLKILFIVKPLDTTINLVYPPFSFSDSQSATVTLTNPYKVTGRFNVTAKTASALGDSISRSLEIRIN